MGDAVIVSAARTPIGTARKGTLAELHRVRPRPARVGEALKRSGIPVDDVDDIVLGEVLQGGGDIARYAAIELGLIDVPGIAHNRHCASGMAAVQTAAASIRAGMDTRRDRRRHRESITQSPQRVQEAARAVPRRAAVAVAEPPRDARRADDGHVDHRRLEHRAEGQRHPRGAGPLGVPLAHAARSRRSTRAASRRRSSRSRSRSGRARPASSTSTSTRAATPRSRSSPRSRPLHPEIAGFSITAGNSSGLNDGRCAMVVCRLRLRRGHGLEPLAIVRSWASAGAAAGRHRPRPDARDPEGARPRRA